MKTNTAVIEELYTYFASRDTEGIKGIFAENIEWKQMDGFPNGGLFVGFDAIAENVFNGFRENWTGWKANVLELLDAGDSVLAVGYYEGTYNLTGKTLKADFIHRYQLDKGKVVKFNQYTDTYLVVKAMGL